MPPFAKHLLLIFFLFFVTSIQAATYYFSSADGDDSRPASAAQNPATPWRTLDKLNAFFKNLQPGDVVLFKRGDAFFGTLIATASGSTSAPISFGAYGSGAAPVISGFVTPDEWKPAGNNRWEARLSVPTVNSVLVNGAFQPIGRYPNSGYLTIDAVNGNASFRSNALSSLPNFTGGEVVIRKNRWILDRNAVTAQSSNALSYVSGSGYEATAGYGFFFQNHPATLDQNGEWYFQNGRLGIYATASPSSVQASVVPVLLFVTGQSNLRFADLNFAGANETAVDVRNAQNISLSNCAVLYSGATAVSVNNTAAFVLENCTLDYTANLALLVNNSPGAVIRANTLRRTGSVAGMGRSGDGSYWGIQIAGGNALVEKNTIEQTGYVPVSFSGSNVTVQNNFINGFTLVKDDGGAIYTWNNGANAPAYTAQKITGNVVLNGNTANEGTAGGDNKFSHGIYLDDNTANVEVSGNTVANCEGFGLYVHNARNNLIKQNTFYNNTAQLEMVHDDIAPNSPVAGNEVSGNLFASLLPAQMVAEFKTNGDDLAGFGNFSANVYSRPFDEGAVIGLLKRVNGTYSYQATDLEGWQALYGKDAGSKASPKTFLPYTVAALNGGNKFGNGSFASNVGGLYAYSPANNCQTWWSSNALDGGTLAVGFSSNSGWSKGTVVMGVGALSAGKKYLLRFSLKGGAEQKFLDVYLRRSGAPYNDVSERKQIKIKSSRREVSFLFTATESTSDASIGIDVPEQSSPVYFDNVDLREATASKASYTDSVRLVYNATAEAGTTALNGTWLNANGAATYNGSINLQPWSSAVLLAGSGVFTPPVTVCSATGTILRERWLNVSGNDVSNIPTATPAAQSDQLPSLEEAPGGGNNYGSRIRGYLCAPLTGNYTFWLAADDGAELWLSTDSLPSHKTKIAYNLSWTGFREWNKFASQKSATIYLEAGKKYYIEALHKQGNGGDHLSVAWQWPDGTTEAPVAGNRLSPFVPAPTGSQCSATGFILREQWNNVDGNDVAQIPVNAPPSSLKMISSFEGPQNAGDRYGSRIRGYVCPPQSGNYTFWIAGDDGTELWLSTDDASANKTKIAYSLSWTGFREWDKFGSQKSAAVYLEAGKKYYIEALQKEGGGGDHLSVAWQLPDGTMEAPIGGNRLSPYVADLLAEGMLQTAPQQRSLQKEEVVVTNKPLLIAYPNPFSTAAFIEFTAPQTGRVHANLFDASGRIVLSLFDGVLQKDATQRMKVDGTTLKTGVYLVRVETLTSLYQYKLICLKE